MPGKMPFPMKKGNQPPPQMKGKGDKKSARADAIKRRMMKNGDKPGGY